MNGLPAVSALSSAVRSDVTLTPNLILVVLVSLRLAVALAMTPVLNAMPIPNRIKVLLVLGLSVLLVAGLDPAVPLPGPGFGALLRSAFMEVTLGAVLGLGILLAFAAFGFAGNLLDVQIGFGIAQVFDPVNNRAAPLLVSAFNYAAVIGFFLVDGHHALLKGLAYSLEVFPAGTAWSLEAAIEPIAHQVSSLFALGFALAAPVAFSILLVEFALGVISRNLPQINMLVLGIPVKIVVGLAVLSLWFGGMGGAMGRVYISIYKTWDAIFLSVASHPNLQLQLPVNPPASSILLEVR